jgi:hypothetical protein
MATAPQALIRSFVQRLLPSAVNPDGPSNDVALRLFPYGELSTQPLVRKSHNLADEGSYFLANNGVTAVSRQIGTSFVATVAGMVIQNNSANARLYLDYVAVNAITATTAASGATLTNYAIAIDTGSRYSSGGTSIAPFSPNLAVSNPTGIATIYTGQVTATAATAAVRTVIGTRIFRPAASGTALSVVGDMTMINFGNVEMTETGNIVVANASIIPHAAPPIIIGPTQSMVMYTWLTATTPAAGTDIWEVGFWVR